jgi:hypothetical protein
VEGAGHVQLGRVGIAESARGDSVIVGGLARRTGSLEEKKKKGQSDIRETCPGWATGSSAPAQSKEEQHSLAAPLSEAEVPLLYPWLPTAVLLLGCSLGRSLIPVSTRRRENKDAMLLTKTWPLSRHSCP